MYRILSLALFALATPVSAEYVTENTAVLNVETGWREADGTHIAGLTITLDEGWHTYWRSPGDAGIPPRFNWSGSRNLAAVDVQFPIPHVIEQNGFVSLGYEDVVTLPLHVTPVSANEPVEIRGEIQIGVCEEICVPMMFEISAVLPTKGAPNAALKSALADQPTQGGSMVCNITPIADGLRMQVTTDIAQVEGELAMIETAEPGVWVSQPELSRSGEMLTADVEMVAPTAQPFSLARSGVRMTIFAGGGAVEISGCS